VYNLAQKETPTLVKLETLLSEMIRITPRIASIPSSIFGHVGSDPQTISPFSGRWMSFLDPSKAVIELGFHHEPLGKYLEKVGAAFLDTRPVALPLISPPERPKSLWPTRFESTRAM
jgi:hypothetical protein